MAISHAPPKDWDDVDAWDEFHRHRLELRKPIEIAKREISHYLRYLRAFAPMDRVWFPGCGISLFPAVLATFGLNVVATDTAEVAIEFQQRALDLLPKGGSWLDQAAREVEPMPMRHDAPKFGASLQDFRDEPAGQNFDAVLNIRALQGLTGHSLESACECHFLALKPGGFAVFETQNVQGERRETLEQALLDAGFVIPLVESERWYRHAAQATGIEHAFVLGNPIPIGEQRNDDEAREVLRGLFEEYQTLRELEFERTKPLLEHSNTKIAQLIYNTG